MLPVIGALLFVAVGLALGLLGGGGSILTLPILVYVFDIGGKEAIAMSLAVVGATSAAALIPHARAGNVRWKVGAGFGAAAMGGAYLGGLWAQYIPERVLLTVFAALMALTAIAMLRKGKPADAPRPARRRFALQIVLEGTAVGIVTGMVGAGGGFVVVPALVLLGGLDMRAAVGTSLLVIAMKSAAGLAGHLSHVTIDGRFALLAAVAAIVGAFAGTAASRRVQASNLRVSFAALLLVMAAWMLHQQLAAWLVPLAFAERWPFWFGGVAIGLFVVALWLATGQRLGVSSGFLDACAAPFDPVARRSWRLRFLLGIVTGGAASAVLAGPIDPGFAVGMFDRIVGASLPIKALVFTSGGVLIGLGARLAGGCTSGHGIVGMALLRPASLVATMAFMVGGFAATRFVLVGFGG